MTFVVTSAPSCICCMPTVFTTVTGTRHVGVAILVTVGLLDDAGNIFTATRKSSEGGGLVRRWPERSKRTWPDGPKKL